MSRMRTSHHNSCFEIYICNHETRAKSLLYTTVMPCEKSDVDSCFRLAGGNGLRDVNSTSALETLVSLGLEVANGSFDSIFRQHCSTISMNSGRCSRRQRTRAMKLDRWQAEFLCNFRVANLARFSQSHALDPFRHV